MITNYCFEKIPCTFTLYVIRKPSHLNKKTGGDDEEMSLYSLLILN